MVLADIKNTSKKLEKYFQQFRQEIIGINGEFESPYGRKKMIYADWTASGRLYRPIEEKLLNEIEVFSRFVCLRLIK